MDTFTKIVPAIPESAPFSESQRAWLNGFLAGLYSEQAVNGSEEPVRQVTILFGSQTGNSEGLARKASKIVGKAGGNPTVIDMAEYSLEKMGEESCLLIVTSTYGEGDPPDNAQALYDFLYSEAAPSLDQLEYSVLGLGDSGYPDFCQCSRDFDKRLAELGAKRVAPMVECDVDFDEPFDEWVKGVTDFLDSPTSTDGVEARSDEPAIPVVEYGKKNPFPAKLLNNQLLSGEGSGKEVRHFEFSFEGSGMNYQAGDALGVVPQNCPELVEAIISKTELNPLEVVPLPGGGDAPLKEALTVAYDIRLLNAAVMKKLLPILEDPDWVGLLEKERRTELNDFLWGRELIDILEPCFRDGKHFVSLLRKLQPRLYSISSSPNAHPGEVHLTVGAVRYEGQGVARKGVCSTYLADRSGEGPVGVFVHHNQGFRLPEDQGLPIIMVGPGTGIAPFRAFLEEREASGGDGKNWLFFGDRSEETDYLYEEQIKGFQQRGVLSRLDLAFSRDQPEKIYVQDRMMEQAGEIWKWLQEGGCFYVCGDASRMAKDVDLALHKIVAVEGNLSEELAEAYVQDLRKSKRYQRDVY